MGNMKRGMGTASDTVTSFVNTGTGQYGDAAGDTQTFYGNTTTSGNPTFAWSGSGTFTTPTGAVTLAGNTSIPGIKTLTVGTGATTLGGVLNVTGAITATATYTSAAGNIVLTGGDLSVGGSSTFTGTATFNGATVFNGSMTLGDAAIDTLTILATPTFDENAVFEKEVEVNGAFTTIANATIGGTLTANGNTVLGNAITDTIVATAKMASDLVWAAGSYDFDMSASTGTFDFPSGAISVPGAITFTANVDMDFVAAERLEITSSGHTGAVDAVIINMTSSNAGVIRGLTVLQNAAATQLLDVGILVDNTDATMAITDAFSATCSGAMANGIVTAFNGSDANITNALLAGGNDVSGTLWSITGATGAIICVGVNAGAGTVTGATLTDGTFTTTAGALSGCVSIANGVGIISTAGFVDITPTGATAGDLLDITRSATATAGNAIDIAMGAAVVGGNAINIVMGGATGYALQADGNITTTGAFSTTGTGALTIAGVTTLNGFVDIAPAGATAANLIDLTRSATATAGDGLAIAMGAAVVAGNAISVVMGGATGSAFTANGAIVTTGATGTATFSALATFNGLVDVTPTGATAANLIDVTRSATATAGHGIAIDMGAAVVAGDGLNITMNGSTGNSIIANNFSLTKAGVLTTAQFVSTTSFANAGALNFDIDTADADTALANLDLDVTAETGVHTNQIVACLLDAQGANVGSTSRAIYIDSNGAGTAGTTYAIQIDATQAWTRLISTPTFIVSGVGAVNCVGLVAGAGAITNTGGMSGTSWSVTDAGVITGTTLTDGNFSTTAGAVTGVTTINMSGNLTVGGTVDGVDIAAHTHTSYYTISMTGPAVLGAGNTRYIAPDAGSWQAAETLVYVAPEACTIVAMYASAGIAPAAGETVDFTIMKNAGAEAMTMQLAGADTTVNTVANPISLNAGDKVTVRAVASNNGSQACSNVSCSLRISSTTSAP